jgi:hypothetical protein
MKAPFQYDEEFLSSMRKVADPAADDFVLRCFADPAGKAELYRWLEALDKNSDLADLPEALQKELLFRAASILPGWADEKIMQAGMKFFKGHSNHIMQLLGLLSLPYCYAAANGAMVLYLSERLKRDTKKRLTDTGKFVWDVLSVDAFSKEGRGFSALLKTRLIHAIVRYYTLLSHRWRMEWGYPVNQEDMAGTNLAFSLIIIRGLRKTGLTVGQDEQIAFIHLWAVISSLLGVDERLIPANGKEANWQEKVIRGSQFKASDHGKELTDSLIKAFIETNESITPSEIRQLIRFLLEDDVAGFLGLDRVEVPAQLPYFTKIFFALNRFYGSHLAFRNSVYKLKNDNAF